MNRRRLILSGAAALLSLPVHAMTVQGTAAGMAIVNVRNKGARGDGVHDDTAAFQAAIDGLPPSGGIVEVPAGRYLLDPLHTVRLRNQMHLRLAPGARLRAKPNAAERAYVLLVQGARDVEISGGEIVGDRDTHLSAAGEWGHALAIRGSSRVTVRDMRISRCWGDGISISKAGLKGGPSTDILIERVVCRGNRRQGLTIGSSRRVRVVDCEFSDTYGTKPEYGIDIEPDYPDDVRDVRIERCVVRGNRGGGIQVYRRVAGVTIGNCTIERNGYGIWVQEASDGVITGNRISHNRHAGIALRKQASNYRIGGNYFRANGRPTSFEKVTDAARGHIQVAPDARDITISGNEYDYG